MRDARTVGRVGLRALIDFDVVTTAALAIGLVSVNLLAPGARMYVEPAALDVSAIAACTSAAHDQGVVGYLSHIILPTPFDPPSKAICCRYWANAANRCTM